MVKRVVEAAVAVIGDVPYRHYDFLLLGDGRGGLEHRNSVAAYTNVPNLDDAQERRRWLGFLAHEFFHLYNVKAIRPIALGPFDYDRENYTDLLWLSEGVTVYYEDLVLNRAGFLPRDACLERFREHVLGYEARPGHRLQSARQASRDVWLYFLRPDGDTANTTISYYDKGAALGLLLDLKVRHETRNERSLDDVMRTLYDVYYKQKRRGFTDAELRQVCETVAGASLAEIFDVYASTTADVDYSRYLAYAGLQIQLAPRALAGASLGAATREQDGRLVVTGVTRDSAAARAGLGVNDEILAFDGVRVGAKALADQLKAAAPGDKVRLLTARRDHVREVEVVLDRNLEPSFTIQPLPNPDALQSETLDAWLPNVAETSPVKRGGGTR
jgi:predicted metalloprotease with PDZ domain